MSSSCCTTAEVRRSTIGWACRTKRSWSSASRRRAIHAAWSASTRIFRSRSSCSEMSRKTTTQPVVASSRRLVGDRGGHVLDGHRAAVGPEQAGLGGLVGEVSVELRADQDLGQRGDGPVGAYRQQAVDERAPHGRAVAAEELLAVGVDRHDPTAQVEGGQPLAHQVGDVAQPPGLARQRPLAFDLLGHVRPDRDDTGRHATRIGEHAVADVHRERAAVGVYAVELALPAAGIQHRGPGLAAEHAVGCRQRQLDDVAPDGLGGGPPVQVPGAVVPDLHGPVEVGGDHRRSDGVEHLVAQVELAPCRPGQRPGVRRALARGQDAVGGGGAVGSVRGGAGHAPDPVGVGVADLGVRPGRRVRS